MQLSQHPQQACHRLQRTAAAATQRRVVAQPSSQLASRRRPAAAAVAPCSAPLLVPRSRTLQQQIAQQRQWQLLPAAAAAASSSSGAESGQQPPAENEPPSTPMLPAAAASTSSSGDAEVQQPPADKPQEASKPKGGLMTWFDRLPAQTQLGVMGGLLFVAAVVGPFLQPTWLYGSSISAPGKIGQITEAQQASQQRYQLPRYIPVASELYDFLQDNAMPTVLPDGRSESPGVLRIYMCSMIILCLFYVCSAVVSLILRGVAGVLRAVGVMGPAPPPPKPEEQS